MMLVLIVYDIPDNKRRTRLAKFLEGYGQRIQLSVFECYLSLKQMRQLYQKVESKVIATEDDVRFYWLSSEAVSKVLTIGSKPPQAPPTYYVI